MARQGNVQPKRFLHIRTYTYFLLFLKTFAMAFTFLREMYKQNNYICIQQLNVKLFGDTNILL